MLQLLLTFFRNLVSIPDRPLTGSAMEKGQHTTQVTLGGAFEFWTLAHG